MSCVGERQSDVSLTLKTLLLSEEDIISASSIIHSMKALIFSSLCRWPICSSGHSCSSQMKETHPEFSSQSTDRFHYQMFSSRTTKTCNFLCISLDRNTSWCNEWAVYSFRPVWSLFGPFKTHKFVYSCTKQNHKTRQLPLTPPRVFWQNQTKKKKLKVSKQYLTLQTPCVQGLRSEGFNTRK